MKKICLIISLIVCLFCFVACNNQDDTQSNVQSGENDVLPGEQNPEEDNSGEDVIPEPSEEMTNLVNTIVDAADARMSAEYTAVIDPEMSQNSIGLTTEEFNENIEDSITYGSQINVSAQEVTIVKVKDSSKAAEIKKEIFDNANPRKWICVTAKKVVAVDSGNYILFVMGEEDLCDNLVKAFSDNFDGNVGETLSLVVEEDAPIESDTPDGGFAIPMPQ